MEDNRNAFEKEYLDTLCRLSEENSKLAGFKYFLKTAYRYGNISGNYTSKPNVVILGTAIPEELVVASGAEPYWIIGGSLGSISWSDELVPRDTDPVSRSILGYIHRPTGIDFSSALFVIPLLNDSMRKIAYELRYEGRKICTVDIPPERSEKNATARICRQMNMVCAAVADHTGASIARRSLNLAVNSVACARKALREFLTVSRGRYDIITDAARLFVSNTYYMNDCIDEWTLHLETLTKQIAQLSAKNDVCFQDRPGVMIVGSPVIFPNYKIPFLVSDIGLSILNTADCMTVKSHISYSLPRFCTRNKLIETITLAWYGYDTSSSYVINHVMNDYTSWLIKSSDIEGIVFHVLKGQIEYDFELERIEALANERGIHVFRLETDYQYQDVEQLRIRMEAFFEMLVQNRYREVRSAS